MQLLAVSTLAVFVARALASETITGQWTCVNAGDYQLCQDLWGEDTDDATSGSQNATLYSASGDAISWSTTYTWAGGEYDVKSYTNVQQTSANGMTLSKITSAPTSWTWEYQSISSDLVADVSYDIWIGTTASGAGTNTTTYEVMIWVSTEGGAGPLGSVIKSGISVGGYAWDLYSGENTYWTTVSFVTTEGNLNDFSSDLKDFFTYLIDNIGMDSSNYLQSVESGTEPFTGSATLYTESFAVTINT
ncbi:glycoside hydrolase family 12 protein [Laetiporus sulphureus 93-53]|uniref:Glycoside hydrolase family 12 protein n=1 Tax=Laetiporus sulphureus 93-53 TaxID=1314785 RepID=A0A165HV80_9APHY|nr:glycoside hydrolase family 12 protein [Laetiporus sulphureus 93-53]KZT12232.1 glycoside hydrolase family 12 protein [Laetiporus sulphureus 93-53]